MEKMHQAVKKARLAGDHEALSRMGKKGGEQAAIKRALRKEALERRLKELALEEAKLYSVSPEGDILPPDPNIIESLSAE